MPQCSCMINSERQAASTVSTNSSQPAALQQSPLHTREQSSPAHGWQALYWEQQRATCSTYDAVSCCLKILLLLGNVRRSLGHGEIHATHCAAGAALLVMLTLLLMMLCPAHYSRYRRLVMWGNLVAISVMMAGSMPQFLSATSSSFWAHRVLVLLFKMGVTWPIMAALMHRLPWQDLALLCCGFCAWLSLTWPQHLCSHLHSSAGDTQLIRTLAAALDSLTGLGMNMNAAAAAAAGGDVGASVSAGGGGSAEWAGALPQQSSSSGWDAALLQTSQAATAAVAGAGGEGEVFWTPLAYQIAAACPAGITSASGSSVDGPFAVSSSSSNSSFGFDFGGVGVSLPAGECDALLLGQCMAVVTTLTLWVGVLVIVFCVVLSEQHSKWRWWHSSSARWLGRPPAVYAHRSCWSFLCQRLLYLHVLLDLPLMLLWVATSSWYRHPPAALGKLNMW